MASLDESPTAADSREERGSVGLGRRLNDRLWRVRWWLHGLFFGTVRSLVDRTVGKQNMKRWLRGEIHVAKVDVLAYSLILHARDRPNGTVTSHDEETIRRQIRARGSYYWSPAGPYATMDSNVSEEIPLRPWAAVANELLTNAEMNVSYRPEEALRSFFAAKRYLMIGQSELRRKNVTTIARTILQEASTLPETWKRDSIVDILTEDGELRPDLLHDDVIRAAEILHDLHLESFRRVENVRVNILNFVLTSAAMVVLLVAVFPGFLSLPPELSAYGEQSFYVLVLLFGAIGAAVSGIFTLNGEPETIHSSVKILGYWLSVARTVTGAVSALLVTLFVLSGLVNGAVLTLPLLLGLAFASGFSERLLLRAVGTLEGTVPK